MIVRSASAILLALAVIACAETSPNPAPSVPDAGVGTDVGARLPDTADARTAGPTVLSISPSDEVGVVVADAAEAGVTAAWDTAFLAAHSTGFGLRPRLVITVSDAVDADSVTPESIALQAGDQVIPVDQRIVDGARVIAWPARVLAESTTYEVRVSGLTAGGQPVAPANTTLTSAAVTDTLDAIRGALDAGPASEVVIEATTAAPSLVWTAHRATLPPGTAPHLPYPASEGGQVFTLESTHAEAGGVPVELGFGATGFTGALPPGGGPVRIFQRYRIARPASVAEVRVGTFVTPWHLTGERLLAKEAVSTRTVGFTLYLPAGTTPEGGWPVVLYANGYQSHRHHAVRLAGDLAHAGMATLAITAVGHGGGPDGTMTLGDVTVSDHGRAEDTDGDGVFSLQEGMAAAWDGPSHGAIRGLTDGVRQSVVDFMVAARALAGGKVPGVLGDSLSVFGVSNGSRIAALLMATDPLVSVGVLNVPPSEAPLPLTDFWRDRWKVIFGLTAPPLLNAPDPEWGSFNEDMPLPGAPVQVGLAEGADAIQAYLDRIRWATAPMDTAVYAQRFHERGVRALVQFARADPLVLNPATAALVDAGDLRSTTVLVRPQRTSWKTDLGQAWLASLHVFAFMPETPGWGPGAIGAGARDQVAAWFSSGGQDLHDPDPDALDAENVFEVPIRPESLDELRRSLGFVPSDGAWGRR